MAEKTQVVVAADLLGQEGGLSCLQGLESGQEGVPARFSVSGQGIPNGLEVLSFIQEQSDRPHRVRGARLQGLFQRRRPILQQGLLLSGVRRGLGQAHHLPAGLRADDQGSQQVDPILQIVPPGFEEDPHLARMGPARRRILPGAGALKPGAGLDVGAEPVSHCPRSLDVQVQVGAQGFSGVQGGHLGGALRGGAQGRVGFFLCR